MRSPWWWAVVLWVVAGLALAAEGGGEPQVEAGMLVSGRIVVGPDGKPSEYQPGHRGVDGALPQPAAQLSAPARPRLSPCRRAGPAARPAPDG